MPRYLLVFDSFVTRVFFRRLPSMQPDPATSPTYEEDRLQVRHMMGAVYAVLATKMHAFSPTALSSIVTGELLARRCIAWCCPPTA